MSGIFALVLVDMQLPLLQRLLASDLYIKGMRTYLQFSAYQLNKQLAMTKPGE